MREFILSAFGDEIAESLDEQMDVLEANDIRYIEIRGVNGKNIVCHTIGEVKDIKTKLKKRNFRISAIGSPIGKIGINDDFKSHLELFKHTLNITEELETGYIRMFSFFIPKGEDPGNYREKVMDRWFEFIKAAEGRGITLLHENEKGIYGDTPERCLDIFRAMNCKYLKATFDPANFVQCDVKTYPEGYGILKDYIEYMHIKDAVYSDHHVVPAGEGDGRVKEILMDLHKKDFKGFLSIEPHLKGDIAVGGRELFEIAANAIKKILCEIKDTEVKK